MKHPLSIIALCSISQVLSAYELHEWGTFTTVSGSNGETLAGLHIEEEHLPPFVYSHAGMQNFNPYAYRIITSPQLIAKNKHQMFVRKDTKNVLQPAVSMKGMQKAFLKNVTVKMETPVIYFYGDEYLSTLT